MLAGPGWRGVEVGLAQVVNSGVGWWREGCPEHVARVLALRAQQGPEALAIALEDGRGRLTELSYGELWRQACHAAAGLAAVGVKRGDRVAMVLPTGQPFLAGFFGILILGAAPAPLYPPARREGLDADLDRLARQLKAAKPSAILSDSRLTTLVGAAAHRADLAAWVGPPASASGPAVAIEVVGEPEDVALVQFSSGSTGHPKGVVLTHRHILANILAVLDLVLPGPEDVNASWLPLYHDMGLIGGLLMPLVSGNPLALMPPEAFILDPKRWPWLVSKHKATVSTAPTFAYQLCATRLADEELAGLDLSAWRIALCGAEPVAPEALAGFAERYRPYGFNPKALAPVYGLAEVALAAAFPTLGEGLKPVHLDRAVLEAEALARQVAPTSPDALVLASVGRALPGYALRVALPSGQAAPEGQVGEIQLQGPSVMQGYLGDAQATAAALGADGWLRTGDLGVQVGGELLVVGRAKDLIVKAGRNLAPQDLEVAAGGVPGVRTGRAVAFGVADAALATERVVVLAETRLASAKYPELAAAVAAAVMAAVGLKPDEVLLLPPGALPRTSSGKLRRAEAKARYEAGALQAPKAPSPLAWASYLGRAALQRVKRRGAARGHA